MRGPPRFPAESRTVAFPAVGRGYERRAVDAYVMRVNRFIAELEATRSPETVLERAYERAEDQRKRILWDAREAAAKIIAAAEQEADQIASASRAKAVDLVVTAGDEAERASAEVDNYSTKARAEAERILAEAVTEAARRLAWAEEEIEALRKEAQAWQRAFRIDTNAIWGERRELLADLHAIAAQLEQTAVRFGAGAATEHDSRP